MSTNITRRQRDSQASRKNNSRAAKPLHDVRNIRNSNINRWSWHREQARSHELNERLEKNACDPAVKLLVALANVRYLGLAPDLFVEGNWVYANVEVWVADGVTESSRFCRHRIHFSDEQWNVLVETHTDRRKAESEHERRETHKREIKAERERKARRLQTLCGA